MSLRKSEFSFLDQDVGSYCAELMLCRLVDIDEELDEMYDHQKKRYICMG